MNYWWKLGRTQIWEPSSHPDYLTALPTADMDIICFELKPTATWTDMAFYYGNEPMYIRYKTEATALIIEVNIPKVHKESLAPDSLATINEWYKCAIWLDKQQAISTKELSPFDIQKYSLFEGIDLAFQITLPQEPYFIGFYTCDWH